MEPIYIGIIVVLGAFLFWVLYSRRTPQKTNEDQVFLMLQSQMQELLRTVDSKLSETHKFNQDHLSKSAQLIQNISSQSNKVISEITEKLTKLDETNKQVISFSSQLQNLQDILKNPKQRGILGEYYLQTILDNVLPPGSYQMQYEFRDGLIVDAVIFVKDKIIPIDSKFSLDNYNRLIGTQETEERKKLEDSLRRDLKERIDETSKYIKPSEGTLEFAFMFIPSEALFYDLLINKVGSVNARDLIEYAQIDKKVVIVSPTSFFAYLQTVLQGLKALKIEESAKEIRSRVDDLGRHLKSYETYMMKLGNHLGTTVSMYNQASKELGKIDRDVLRITGSSAELEPVMVDKPNDFLTE
ncbi:MAG: DNA recombination protein RmuC [Anaplasmataceae bacterium]|nr:DNA recombination protein RmuC [Anaplasmataceae bacterium]